MSTQVEQLRRRIVDEVNAGEAGAKLGSERELADRYGTSRSSLRQVLAALEEAGLIERVIGRAGGIFISHGQVQRSLTDVVGVPAFLANQGYTAGTRVLSTKITAPDRAGQHALGLTSELAFDLFYGAGTLERDYTVVPTLSLQLGVIVDFEVLP